MRREPKPGERERGRQRRSRTTAGANMRPSGGRQGTTTKGQTHFNLCVCSSVPFSTGQTLL
eukprot:14552596-Alexandrium_andersonii.AAC.1